MYKYFEFRWPSIVAVYIAAFPFWNMHFNLHQHERNGRIDGA